MRTSSTATVMWIVPSLTLLLLLEAGLLAKSLPAPNWDGKDHSEILKDLALNYEDHTRDPRENTGKERPTKAIEEFHVTFVLHLCRIADWSAEGSHFQGHDLFRQRSSPQCAPVTMHYPSLPEESELQNNIVMVYGIGLAVIAI